MADKLVGFRVFATPEHIHNSVEVARDVERQIAPAGFVRVERVLIELEPLFGYTAEDHRAETAVPYRQGLIPIRSGLSIPQPQGGFEPWLGALCQRSGACRSQERSARKPGGHQSELNQAPWRQRC